MASEKFFSETNLESVSGEIIENRRISNSQFDTAGRQSNNGRSKVIIVRDSKKNSVTFTVNAAREKDKSRSYYLNKKDLAVRSVNTSKDSK